MAPRLIDRANACLRRHRPTRAKRGSNASELIGVVLSRLPGGRMSSDQPDPKAWIFLGDYAAWLGQDEKRIADLLCLAPGRQERMAGLSSISW